MGFPSPAMDYIERRLSLDELLETYRPSTYFMRAAQQSWRHGISCGAILVVDRSRRPCSGSLVICSIAGEFKMRVLRLNPSPRLEYLDEPDRWDEMPNAEGGDDDGIWGVIRYIVNSATDSEFDDVPVI